MVARLTAHWIFHGLFLVGLPAVAEAATFYSRGGPWNAPASWSTESCSGADAPRGPRTGDQVVLCPDRIVEIPCGETAEVGSITTDPSWTLASGGGLLADHSSCPVGEVGRIVFGDGGGVFTAGARLRNFGPAAVLMIKGRRIASEITLDAVTDPDAGDDDPVARCEDGVTRGSVAAAQRAGDCFEVSHAPLGGLGWLDASEWAVAKQPLVFFLGGRYRDGFARVVQTPDATRARLAFTQPDQTYAQYAAAHATVLHAFDATNPTRIVASVRTGTLPHPIPCEGPCWGSPATGDGGGALAGMCLVLAEGGGSHPILGTIDGGDGDDRLVLEQDARLAPADLQGLPRPAWIAPCIRPGQRVEVWEPFVVGVAQPGTDRGGFAIQGDACPALEGVQFLKTGPIRTFSSELGGEGNDALLELYENYAGCTIEGPVAVDGVYYVGGPGTTNGPYPLHIDNVRNLTVRRFAEQGFYQNGGGDLAVPHSVKLQDCEGVVLDRHSVGWLPNESPWMSPLDAFDESANGVPEGVGVELSNFNIHDVWSPPGVWDGNGGPNFLDGAVDRGTNRILIHDGMIWNVEAPLAIGMSLPTSEAYVWNVVIGAPHWPRDAYASGVQVGILGTQSAGAPGPARELLANSVVIGGISQASAFFMGLQNWQEAYYSAIGESLYMDSFNAPIDRVRRHGMLYRQSGPTMLAEYAGGGGSEALAIPRSAAMSDGTAEDPNVSYRDIVVKRSCRVGVQNRGIGVQNAQPPLDGTTRFVVALEGLTLGLHCPDVASGATAGTGSFALTFHGDVDAFLDAESRIRSVLAVTGNEGDSYGAFAVAGTSNGIGGPAISDVLCSRCSREGAVCSAADHCLSGGEAWTRDLATMSNLGSAAAMGVRSSTGADDLMLVAGSPAWPSASAGHLGAGYAGLAVPFATLDDYGIRLADWHHRATPGEWPDLTVVPEWIRVRLGSACANGVDDDGDGFVDFPADPGCRDATNVSESAKCQNGRDDDADGRIDYDGGASLNGGIPLAPPDPACRSAWIETEVSSCGLGAELVVALALASRLRRRVRRPPA